MLRHLRGGSTLQRNRYSGGAVVLSLLLFLVPSLRSQTFTKVIDAENPIINGVGPVQYAGASWIDYDSDGDLDLFINNHRLYRNDGEGTFVALSTSLGQGQAMNDQITGYGNTWADYDNDGDIDCYISSATSFLYRNDGDGVFTKITSGDIGNGFAGRGWAGAWADYNNDGYVDLAVTNPYSFVPGDGTPNHLFRGNGPPNYTFTRITQSVITEGLAPYTVGTWSDYDLDGDMDYFIGSGPANGTTAPDNLYRNLLVENGSADFVRITDAPIATDPQDGQVWNWVDIDNDLDLDAYVTNWGGTVGGLPNSLYRNDGGVFTRIESGEIVTDVASSLSSVWGDYDNDGDLDCYVGNDNNMPDRFYQNLGDGTFVRRSNALTTEFLTHRGASAGDYDNDGDLDLVAVGPATATALYRNDTENGNHWIEITCVGTESNRSAIGARVEVRAVIGGKPVGQLREISAQNTFNGQNSLRVHVGLGDAEVIDTVKIRWPSGTIDVLTDVPVDRFTTVSEGETSGVDGEEETDDGMGLRAYPNPFTTSTAISYRLSQRSYVVFGIYDLLGREVATLFRTEQERGQHTIRWNGENNEGKEVANGIYTYVMTAQGSTRSGAVTLGR